MPRKNPLPSIELEICNRLRTWRESLGFSRVFFAARLSIDSSWLASIEHGRSPLRYPLAYRLFQIFALNPFWLATGEGPVTAHKRIPGPKQLASAHSAWDDLFSSVFSNHIKDAEAEITFGEGDAGRDFARHWIDQSLIEWIAEIPDEHLTAFAREIEMFAEGFIESLPRRESREVVSERVNQMTQARLSTMRRILDLRSEESSVDSSNVKQYLTRVSNSFWESLRQRLSEITVNPGKASALANELKVSRAAVSQWINGKTAPTAELTLHLLSWVIDEEAKQKTLPGATNTQKGKQTRSRKPNK